ncbi:MAG: carboxypeptidase-like regulatory domain-containing protein, partial [Flavobacteriales bacterium]
MRSLYSLMATALFGLSCIIANAQTVSGTVKDDVGPLPGVTIKDVESGTGVATGNDGTYSITLTPGKHTLEFRLLGFADVNREVVVKPTENITIDITMKSADQELDELVIVGYGVQRKREVTGSISKIDG